MKFLAYNGAELGITNQKIALLGLIHRAILDKRKIVIPPLVDFVVGSEQKERHRFFDYFREDHFSFLLNAHNIEYIEHPEIIISSDGNEFYELIDGWECFLHGANLFGKVATEGYTSSNLITCQIIAAFQVTDKISNYVEKLKTTVFNENRTHIAVQMRIENDWAGYTTNILSGHKNENNLPSARDIVSFIKDAFNDRAKQLYVICDEGALPVSKHEIQETIRSSLGVNIHLKSDFLPEILYENNLVKSLVDFEMASSAQIFVGTSRSTFSCFVTLEKFCKGRQQVRNHFIYNAPGNQLVERCDNGAGVESTNVAKPEYSQQNFGPIQGSTVGLPLTLKVQFSGGKEAVCNSAEGNLVPLAKIAAGRQFAQDSTFIEGFSITSCGSTIGFRYRGLFQTGELTDWCEPEQWCGSADTGIALSGYQIELTDSAVMEIDCICNATFSGLAHPITAMNGRMCATENCEQKLTSMEVEFRYKIHSNFSKDTNSYATSLHLPTSRRSFKYEYSVVVCARWEDQRIEEWLAYYKSIGYDHIYLYCNDDAPESLLKKVLPHTLGAAPFVTFIYFEGKGLQQQMYVHFIKKYGSETKWVSFFDVDEFLNLNGKSIHEFMRNYQNHDSVIFYWRVFGDNGFETTPPGDILPKYSRCALGLNEFSKLICRTSSLDDDMIASPEALGFWHNISGKTYKHVNVVDVLGRRDFSLRNLPTETLNEISRLAYLHHYMIKSKEDLRRRVERSVSGAFSGQTMWDTTDETKSETLKSTLLQFNAASDTGLVSYWDQLIRKNAFAESVRLPPTETLISTNKPCLQSSTSPWSIGANEREDASNAVNGVINGRFKFHTNSEYHPWWQIDLLYSHKISAIVIYNLIDVTANRLQNIRIDYADDIRDFKLFIEKKDSIPLGSLISVPFSVQCDFNARYIRITSIHEDFFHLDQVQVFGKRLDS